MRFRRTLAGAMVSLQKAAHHHCPGTAAASLWRAERLKCGRPEACPVEQNLGIPFTTGCNIC